MILVTRLDNSEYYLNPHHIETIEVNANTVILLLSGKKLIVKEKYEDLYQRIVEYRSDIGLVKDNL